MNRSYVLVCVQTVISMFLGFRIQRAISGSLPSVRPNKDRIRYKSEMCINQMSNTEVCRKSATKEDRRE